MEKGRNPVGIYHRTTLLMLIVHCMVNDVSKPRSKSDKSGMGFSSIAWEIFHWFFSRWDNFKTSWVEEILGRATHSLMHAATQPNPHCTSTFFMQNPRC